MLTAEDLARDLLEIGAVVLRPEQPFTWASGLRAPVYCDNRLTLAHPALRTRIADALAARIEADAVAAVVGVATAGIPQAALVAERLGLPMAYVRAQPKGHGRENRIEGRLAPGQRVAVIEDLISTGGSSLAAVEALREAGAVPVRVVAAFSYGLAAAAQRFAEAGVMHDTLTDFETLLAVAHADGALAEADLETLRAWRRDPHAWSERALRVTNHE